MEHRGFTLHFTATDFDSDTKYMGIEMLLNVSLKNLNAERICFQSLSACRSSNRRNMVTNNRLHRKSANLNSASKWTPSKIGPKRSPSQGTSLSEHYPADKSILFSVGWLNPGRDPDLSSKEESIVIPSCASTKINHIDVHNNGLNR